MTRNFILYNILTVSFVTGCPSDNQSKDGLPCIDVRKNYPEKEIMLTDIADITYVHLNTESDEYLYKGHINYVSENTIVVADESSGSILFFSKDGSPKSHFNRYGAGPEEYFRKGRTLRIIYDETKDDVFIVSLKMIHVYSSTGEYKRRLTLTQGTSVRSIVDFDDQSLFLYDTRKERLKSHLIFTGEVDSRPQSDYDSSYFHISKTDGKILDYLIFPDNEIILHQLLNTGDGMIGTCHRYAVKSAGGLFLTHNDIDTVFLYGKDKSLTPLFCKTPPVGDLDPKVVLYKIMEAGRYQFIVLHTLINILGESFSKFYVRDKQTGKIFRQKIILPDYKGKEFFILDSGNRFNSFELDLFELKQADRENRLSGKLKELVATLNEDEDNNVFMFVHYKYDFI